MEDRFGPRLDHPRHHRLRHPIPDRRHAQDSRAPAMRLRDLDRTHRRREVGARGEPVPDLVQVVLQIGLELRDRHRVHAGRALVRLDLLPRLQTARFEISNGLPGAFNLSMRFLPEHFRLTGRIKPRTTRPLRSAPVTEASPLLRTGPPARPATVLGPFAVQPPGVLPAGRPPGWGPASAGTRLLLFRAEAADRARVACMPDTTWPVSGYPPGSSRSRRNTPVPMSS